MEEMGLLYTLLSETLTNIQTVKAFGMERHERRRYHQSGKRYFHRAMRIMFFNALGRASAEFMGMTIICLAIVAGAYLVINQQTTLLGIPIMDQPLGLGSLMAFYCPAGRRERSGPQDVGGHGHAAARHGRRRPRVRDPRPRAQDRRSAAAARRSPIRGRSWSSTASRFSTRPASRCCTTSTCGFRSAKRWRSSAPTAAARRRSCNLLPRFYDPIGRARCGSTASTSASCGCSDLRKLTGLVAQQAMLFDDTVLNNIRYGSPRRQRRRSHRRGRKGLRPQVHRREARQGLPNDRRRARRPALRRPAAADPAGPGDPPRSQVPDPRRSHQPDRPGKRAAHPHACWSNSSAAARR